MLRKVHSIAKNDVEDFIYTYVEEPDSVMHALGVEHEYVKENIRYINSLVCELAGVLDDSLIIVMADHGLIDTTTLYLEDYPKIQEMLVRRPSIESRAVNLYVKDEYKKVFAKEFNKVFGKDFLLLTKEQILDKKLFGNGQKNPRIDDVVGDYMAFGISDKALEWEKVGFLLEARHAGLTKEEMEVPLFIIDTNKL